MVRLRALLGVLALVALLAAAAPRPAAAQPASDIGKTRVVQGFAVQLLSVTRAREAGAADYVAGKGNVFLIVSIQFKRQGSHETYLADPSDFSIQTSKGATIDSEEFGMAHEFLGGNIYSKAVNGVIGFEVPANDHNLVLLWQPTLNSNPDAQASWLIGSAGKQIQYYT